MSEIVRESGLTEHGREPSFDKMDVASEKVQDTEVTAIEEGLASIVREKQTMRHLLPRHIQLMAFSGAIGTGLFVGSGAALARAGPVGLFLGYALYALLVWSIFNAMGEMVVWLPIDGSFVVFAHAYLDDAWGFALGWLYTVTNALSCAGEVAAVAAIVGFWTDSVNSGLWDPSQITYLAHHL